LIPERLGQKFPRKFKKKNKEKKKSKYEDDRGVGGTRGFRPRVTHPWITHQGRKNEVGGVQQDKGGLKDSHAWIGVLDFRMDGKEWARQPQDEVHSDEGDVLAAKYRVFTKKDVHDDRSCEYLKEKAMGEMVMEGSIGRKKKGVYKREKKWWKEKISTTRKEKMVKPPIAQM
jgi:hypothetical protein